MCVCVCVRVHMCVCVCWWQGIGGVVGWRTVCVGGWFTGLLGRSSYRLGLFQIRCEIPSTHKQLEDISVCDNVLCVQTSDSCFLFK